MLPILSIKYRNKHFHFKSSSECLQTVPLLVQVEVPLELNQLAMKTVSQEKLTIKNRRE